LRQVFLANHAISAIIASPKAVSLVDDLVYPALEKVTLMALAHVPNKCTGNQSLIPFIFPSAHVPCAPPPRFRSLISNMMRVDLIFRI
jgi:hypothetical protein